LYHVGSAGLQPLAVIRKGRHLPRYYRSKCAWADVPPRGSMVQFFALVGNSAPRCGYAGGRHTRANAHGCGLCAVNSLAGVAVAAGVQPATCAPSTHRCPCIPASAAFSFATAGGISLAVTGTHTVGSWKVRYAPPPHPSPPMHHVLCRRADVATLEQFSRVAAAAARAAAGLQLQSGSHPSPPHGWGGGN